MVRVALMLAALGGALAPVGLNRLRAEEPLRTWKDQSGKHSIEAAYVKVSDGNVTLRKADGSTISVPAEKLSSEDRHWVIRRIAPEKVLVFAKLLQVATDQAKDRAAKNLSDLETRLKKASRKNRTRLAAELKQTKARAATFEPEEYIPEINPQADPIIVGTFGLFRYPVRVTQVLGPDRFLASPLNSATPFLARGMSTAGLADDQKFTPTMPFVAVETATYTTVTGAKRTVVVVDFVDLSPLKAMRPPRAGQVKAEGKSDAGRFLFLFRTHTVCQHGHTRR